MIEESNPPAAVRATVRIAAPSRLREEINQRNKLGEHLIHGVADHPKGSSLSGPAPSPESEWCAREVMTFPGTVSARTPIGQRPRSGRASGCRRPGGIGPCGDSSRWTRRWREVVAPFPTLSASRSTGVQLVRIAGLQFL